jgi:hypothetical protein
MSLNTYCPPLIYVFLILISIFCSNTLGSGTGDSNTHGQTIDVQCDAVIQSFIGHLTKEKLVTTGPGGQARIKEIALELCSETEKSVQQQHEQRKEQALENWFFEHHADKPGNRRLRKTH